MRVGSSAASTIASTPRRLASRTIPSPALRARTVAVATSTPSYSSPTALARCSALRARLRSSSGDARVERQRHRHLEHPHRLDHRAALALVLVLLRGSRPAVCMMSSSSGVPSIGTRIEPYSAFGARARQRALGDRHALEDRLALARCGRRRRARSRTSSSRRRPSARRRGRMITATNAANDSTAPSAAVTGSSPRADADVERDLERAVAIGLEPAQPDHRQVHDRERDRRAERVDRGEELEVGRDQQQRSPAARRRR